MLHISYRISLNLDICVHCQVRKSANYLFTFFCLVYAHIFYHRKQFIHQPKKAINMKECILLWSMDLWIPCITLAWEGNFCWMLDSVKETNKYPLQYSSCPLQIENWAQLLLNLNTPNIILLTINIRHILINTWSKYWFGIVSTHSKSSTWQCHV